MTHVVLSFNKDLIEFHIIIVWEKFTIEQPGRFLRTKTLVKISQTLVKNSQTLVKISQTLVKFSQTFVKFSQTFVKFSQTFVNFSQTLDRLAKSYRSYYLIEF